MSDRKPYIGGNWKMNLTLAQSVSLTEGLAQGFQDLDKADVAIFPALPYLLDVGRLLTKSGSKILLGAQDVYHQPNGAYTGEVSLAMLRDIGVRVVLVGHSERRHVMGESDELINHKVRAALNAGFDVVLCVGEKLEQRELGQTDAVNAAQTQYGLAGVPAEQMAGLTIAYEPVWAIGTGKTATPEDAQQAHAAIRRTLAETFGGGIARSIRIQYGGSVKPTNAEQLLAQHDIDGALVGGASLKVTDFLPILQEAARSSSSPVGQNV